MCYDDNARPPEPPANNGGARGEDLVLNAADGNRFAAYAALPSQPASAAVLIYPDIRGLHQFYKELALRFADMGTAALALDYFGRTAGLTARDDSFEFWPHVQQLRLESFTLDVQATMDKIHELVGQDAAVFVVGFCMGGSLTLLTGTNKDLGFTGLIPFYAGLSRNIGGQGTVLEQAQRVAYPVLGQFGGADEGIPRSEVEALDQQLGVAGVPHDLKVYEGAPHGFFDRRAAQFAQESADAWQRMLAFIAAHSGQEQLQAS